MRILITGGGGFLGAACGAALLARGDSVIAFDTQFGAPAIDAPGLERITASITDLAALAQIMLERKPDAVLHAGAIVGVLTAAGSPLEVVRVNVEGSINVFEAMRLAGVRRCIHVSSEEAYGEFRAARIDETHPLDPVLPYGVCKAAVEQLGRTYRDLHGLEVINLRTSWVYGCGLPRLRVPRNLVEAALAGRSVHVASGAQVAIDHTYVDDFVSGALAALDYPRHRYDVYNIASGTAPTIAEIVAIVRELVPGAQLSVGPGPYRHGDRIEMVRKGALDVGRAGAELGWRPRYDIRDGLTAYIDALRAAPGSEQR